MRVMVTGGRDWRNINMIAQILRGLQEQDFDETEWYLINGCASGADAIARSLAVARGWEPVDHWPDYATYGFAEANKVRNMEMVDSEPDIILAFPTKNSRGTWHAVEYAERTGYLIGDTLWIYRDEQ